MAAKDSPAAAPATPGRSWFGPVTCLLLALAVWLIYGQTRHHDFINYDDDDYVYNNPVVSQGLTARGVAWAFTHVHAVNWHPLTSVSHMLDCQLHGLQPGGHHLTNVILHAATAIGLFFALRRLTGAPWHSAFAAALFALHPLRVESVAWIAERKDVLSGLFFVLTLWAYARFARHPSAQKRPFASADYWLALVWLALGLLSKPMLVTTPFVLLLLDFWPLNRWRSSDPPGAGASAFKALAIEKLPFLILCIGGSVATLLAQKEGKAITSLDEFTLPVRIANSLVSYITYLKQMVYPAGLAVFYPHPGRDLPRWEAGLALLLLLGLTAAAIFRRRKSPYFLMGWLWYLGMLVPVIGLIQVGSQAHADRYTYLPQIGIAIAFTWGIAEWSKPWRHRPIVLGALAALVLATLAFLAHTQTTHWKTRLALWHHTLACTTGNFIAHTTLANELSGQNKLDEAIRHYELALRVRPNFADTLNNLGATLIRQGKSDRAIEYLKRAVQIKPDDTQIHHNLGNACLKLSQFPEAAGHFQRALQLTPDFAEAHVNLGAALAAQGNLDEAIGHYRQALHLQPGITDAHFNLANALTRQQKLNDAIEHYQQAIRLQPDHANAHNNLGAALAAQGKRDEAINQYRRVLQISPNHADAHLNLAINLAAQGTTDAAMEHYQSALQLAPNNPVIHDRLGLALVKQGKVEAGLKHFQQGLELATSQSNDGLARTLRERLKTYGPRTPPPQ
jgi:tetratricopeptide (TPR) repeat protein